MFSRIRKRITYTNVAMTLALVFTMSGGAYAAGKYLINSTKQINPKVLKALKGKNGTNGKDGAPGSTGEKGASGKDGAQGLVGEKGPKGDTGAAGSTGPQGAAGPAGSAGKDGATGPQGPAGGAGATGPAGPEGVCSTAKCTLPVGTTETGTWSDFRHAPEETTLTVSISFPIQLANALDENHVHFLKANEKTTDCPGSVEKPEATSGSLCVYPTLEPENSNVEVLAVADPSTAAPGADVAGAVLFLKVVTGATETKALGAWAVTG